MAGNVVARVDSAMIETPTCLRCFKSEVCKTHGLVCAKCCPSTHRGVDEPKVVPVLKVLFVAVATVCIAHVVLEAAPKNKAPAALMTADVVIDDSTTDDDFVIDDSTTDDDFVITDDFMTRFTFDGNEASINLGGKNTRIQNSGREPVKCGMIKWTDPLWTLDATDATMIFFNGAKDRIWCWTSSGRAMHLDVAQW